MDKKTKIVVDALRKLANEAERYGLKRGTTVDIKIIYGYKKLPSRGDNIVRSEPTGGRTISGEWTLKKTNRMPRGGGNKWTKTTK